MSRCVRFALLASQCIWASVALADSSNARVHYERGIELYQAEQFGDASAELDQAYTLDPEPEYLFAWAQAVRKNGQCARANELYERLLAMALEPGQPEAIREAMARCVPNEDSEGLTDPNPEEAPVDPPPPAGPDGIAIVLGVVGGATAIAGGVVTIFSVIDESNAEAIGSGAEPGTNDDFDALTRRAQRRRRAGLATIGAGALLVLGSIVRIVLRPSEPPPASVWLSPDGGGVLVHTTF